MASLDDIREVRLQKLRALTEKGIHPYPVGSARTGTVADALSSWSAWSKKKSVTLSGRILGLRGQGAVIFFDFSDGTAKLQGLFKKGETPEQTLSLFSEHADIGDFIEVEGNLFLTKRKEKTILVKSWRMLAKSLRPLPEKWHGLQDVEEKMRRRYLDLLMSPEAATRMALRSRIISEIRTSLDKEGFLEVETPMFHPLYGGASAVPFTSHYESLDCDFYLRISVELYLKRLLVGGIPKVYEMGKNFRNEGIDVTHSPEFTMLEFYESYSDARGQMALVEKLLKTLVKKIHGKPSFLHEGQSIHFSKSFVREQYGELLKRHALLPDISSLDRSEAKLAAERLGIEVGSGDSISKILDSIYKKACRPKLIQPTFIVDYPYDMLPLAKRKEGDPNIADAFQLVIGGVEIAKGFSELNDPLDQRARLEDQEKTKKEGEKDAQRLDEDFLEAMEYGMPPAGGTGIGIDRLVMLLADLHNIRDVILFPTLRPKEQ